MNRQVNCAVTAAPTASIRKMVVSEVWWVDGGRPPLVFISLLLQQALGHEQAHQRDHNRPTDSD